MENLSQEANIPLSTIGDYTQRYKKFKADCPNMSISQMVMILRNKKRNSKKTLLGKFDLNHLIKILDWVLAVRFHGIPISKRNLMSQSEHILKTFYPQFEGSYRFCTRFCKLFGLTLREKTTKKNQDPPLKVKKKIEDFVGYVRALRKKRG